MLLINRKRNIYIVLSCSYSAKIICLFFSSLNLIIYSVNVANPRLMNKILATTKPHPSSESPYFRKEYLFCSQITIWCTKLTSCIISRMPKGNSTIPFLNISRACMLYFELDSLKSIDANIKMPSCFLTQKNKRKYLFPLYTMALES